MKLFQFQLCPIIWYITIFLIIFWSFPSCISSDLQWYNTCGSYFNCGNLTHVGFPFWGGSTRPENCGYPDLELTCEGETTIIHIKGMRYHVLEINQNSQMLTLAREDYLKGICMQKLINTTLDFQHYDYGPDSQNITILYGCPPPYSYTSNDAPGQFTCKISGTNQTAAYPVEGAIGPSGCFASVVVPVLKTSYVQLVKWTLSQVIAHGFEVKYKLQDQDLVTKCGESGGRFGFDVSKNETYCLCPDGSVRYAACNIPKASPKHGHLTKSLILILASISVSVILICTLIGLILYFKGRNSFKKMQDVEGFLKKHASQGPKRYTYSDLKKITSSFKDKLGEGGYGVVYRGKLHDGHQVAVKLLKKSPKEDMEEFMNEVASIGKTNHVNIVKLMGFCYEGGQKRALVFNYLPNGSLEKFTYGGQKNHQPLSWEKLFEISVGIARGLEYLHRGCDTRILHFDIKPQNILLDENFCPKISDFGLAKLCLQKESIISISEARGTIGYIAPEVFFKRIGGVSYKSDVYSYGMLVLEMIGCRNNAEVGVENTSEQYFPEWIYKQLEQVEELNDNHEGILRSVEGSLRRKMVLVSLWCIQTNPMNRPHMTRVVEMLEGDLESLQIPSLASPLISQQNSSTISIGRLFQE